MKSAGAAEQVSVSILVISYECKDMTLRAIETALGNTQTTCELICVDNASRDGSAEAIRERFPEITLVASAENLGFAAANNYAASLARGRRLLLLNPDTEVPEGAIDRLWEYAERTPAAGIWGGRTLFGDGTLNLSSCWNFMTAWTLFCRAAGLTWVFPRSEFFNGESIGGWQRDSEREVDIITGCFLLIDHSLWRKLEGFNPDFFMYGEEADLCYRARKLGARPRISPDATIVHHGGQSEPSSADKLIKVMKGKVTLMNAHWSPLWRFIGRLLFLGMVGVRAVASKFLKPKVHGGAGLDRRDDIWVVALSRRDEWIEGWPLRKEGR